MAFYSRTSLLLGFLVIVLSAISCRSAPPAIKGGYYPSWVYASFHPSSIDTKLFTHIYYAFLSPNNVTFKFEVGREDAVLLANFTSTLHGMHPPVKTLFSVGGAAEGSVLFSRMASSHASRMSFIRSSILVARRFGFDGIDLDWEFPQSQKDMENLEILLVDWRAEVEREAHATGRAALLLSAAVYYSADTFLEGPQRAYPSAAISKSLDWINVMTYDYSGGWNTSVTGAPTALYGEETNVTTSYGLESWLASGVPSGKLVMGLPLYGRTWLLKDAGSYAIGAAAVDVGPGPDRSGVLTYAEVVKYNKDHKAMIVYDMETASVYSVAGTVWIGYDDPKTVAVRIGYARALGLRGYFFWAVNGDYNWKISKTASKLWSHHH